MKSVINATTKSFETNFRSDCGTEEDMLEDSDVYLDLGKDSPDELDMALSERLSEAIKSGLSDIGAQNLKKHYGQRQAGFRPRMGKSPPASVETMRARFNEGTQ